jgi:hypothetical protein
MDTPLFSEGNRVATGGIASKHSTYEYGGKVFQHTYIFNRFALVNYCTSFEIVAIHIETQRILTALDTGTVVALLTVKCQHVISQVARMRNGLKNYCTIDSAPDEFKGLKVDTLSRG